MPIYTKWPRLIVVGEPVTEAQADEILIRTNGWWYLHSNDKRWLRALETVLAEHGYPVEPERRGASAEGDDDWAIRFRALESWMDRMRIVSLEYLHNSQITSAWIGGPHGWCDWEGRIGCSSHNIGKWPNDEEVTDEWRQIAEAFPYLDLTAQCIDEEGEGPLAAEWRVKDGVVAYNAEPSTPLAARMDEPSLFACLMPGGERGVTIDRFRQALTRVAESSPTPS